MSNEQEETLLITVHSSLMTHHSSLFLSAAHRRQNRYLAVVRQRRVEQFFTSNVVVVEKNVYVLPELSLFVQHAIAQANVPAPQSVKSFPNGCSRRVNDDLTLSVGKVS